MTGWFIYRCGKGILLVPAPQCISGDCKGSDGRGTRNIGYAGDIAAGENGSLSGARRGAGLFAASGAEVAGAVAQLGDLRDKGAISSNYFNAAAGAVERNPERYIPTIAPETRREILGQPIGTAGLARDSRLAPGSPVGPDVADACRCTPRDFDAVDPVSGWGIYYINGGVLLTPTRKCIAGGGSIPGWLAMTWRNVLALFKSPPQTQETAAPAIPPPAPIVIEGQPAPPAGPAPCVPDIIIGRDDGMFGSGWWIVLRDGKRILVANPKTC